MKHYEFRCYDDEDMTTTSIEFSTENGYWSGYNGPMWKFFEFLKGCGFVFDSNAEIGIANDEDFTSAV